MISVKLYQALHRIEAYRAVQRYLVSIVQRKVKPKKSGKLSPRDLRDILVLGSLGLIIVLGGGGLLIYFFVLLPLAVIAAGTIAGMVATLSIATLIADQLRRGRAELMGMSPLGRAGSFWLMARGAFLASQDVRPIRDTAYGIYLFFAFALLLPVALGLVTLGNRLMSGSSLDSGLRLLEITAMLYSYLAIAWLDLTQSLSIAVLTGMVAPTFTRDGLNVVFLSGGVFLVLQVTIYVVFWVVGVDLLPDLLEPLGLTGDFPLAQLRLVLFIALREALALALWWLLALRLDVRPSTLGQVVKTT